MKLKSLSLAVVVSAMTLTSCGNSAKTDNDTVAEKETIEAVSQVEADSCEADDVCNDSIVTRGGTASEGFGRCLASGCNCKAFEGRGETCRNCGHAYKKHY